MGVILGLIVIGSSSKVEVGVSEFSHGCFWQLVFDDLFLIEVELIHGSHLLGFVSEHQRRALLEAIFYLVSSWIFLHEVHAVGGYFG